MLLLWSRRPSLPTGLCDLIPYSDSDSDSSYDMISPEYISPLPATSPFICNNSSETSRDSSDGPPSQDPYEVIISRWRSKVIPFSRPYRTHPNGPQKVMTARKRVGPLLARRLCVSPHSLDHHSSSGSSLNASPAHASSRPTPDQSISGYSSPTTTIDNSPAPPRFLYPPIMTPRDSEAYHYWRSPAATMPLHIPASGALVLTHADLLPPRKRFRDSYSSEESIKKDIDDGVGIEVDTRIGMGVEVAREDRIRDIEAG
ncbi:hypothetical protein Tco_1235062 [Tanacetum coccineum]